MSSLDPETVEFYRAMARKAVNRLTDALRKDQPEEETKALRARIKAFEELVSWKPASEGTDPETRFL